MATAAERTRCGHATVGVMGGGAMQVQKRRLAVRLSILIYSLLHRDTRQNIWQKMASGALTAVLALMLLLSHGDSHSIGFGSCKTVTPLSGFDVTKFFGKWYINGLTSPFSACHALFFEQSPTAPNEIQVTQSRELIMPHLPNVHPTENYTGTIVKGNATHPAAMTIKWPISSHIIGSMSFTVIDTDYTNYVLTYECAKFSGSLDYHHSTAILSRNKTLDSAVLQSVIGKAKTAGLDASKFLPISIKHCVPQSDGTAQDSDEHSFNVLGLISDQKMGEIQTESELIKEIGFPESTTPQ